MLQNRKIDPSLFTVDKLLDALLYDLGGNINAWRREAEIIPDYMPPYPCTDTKPSCEVRIGNSFLRREGRFLFWDMYGTDFGTPEEALLALLNAPVPPWMLQRHMIDGVLHYGPEASK
jgi:hypothetical protein